MNDFEYFEPTTLDEAINLLAKYKGKAKVIAGGTDLIVNMKRGLIRPSYLINIKRVAELKYIEHDKTNGIKIGALTTLHELESSPVVKSRIPILSQAAQKVGAPRLRNVGTIGGNLCQDSKCLDYMMTYLWNRPPCYRGGGNICYAVEKAKDCIAMATSETAPSLLCLDARVKIAGSNGERVLRLEDFFVSAGVTKLRDDELIVGVEIPEPQTSNKGAYLKYSRRKAIDFAIVGVAAIIKLQPGNGVCADVRIGLLGVSRTPFRAGRAESVLRGQGITTDMVNKAAETAAAESHPLGDIYASAKVKKRLVRQLVERAINEALGAPSKT